MLRARHLRNQMMERIGIWKKELLLVLGMKWSTQGMRIVQRWRNYFEKLGNVVLAETN